MTTPLDTYGLSEADMPAMLTGWRDIAHSQEPASSCSFNKHGARRGSTRYRRSGQGAGTRTDWRPADLGILVRCTDQLEASKRDWRR